MDEQTRIFLDQDNSSNAPKMEDIPIEEGRRIGEQLIAQFLMTRLH